MSVSILSEQVTFNSSPRGRNTRAAVDLSVSARKPDQQEFERINNIVEAALYTWDLPERVKRLSLPVYRYAETDLEHMQWLLAESGDTGIIGLAALEEADAAECPDSRNTLLLHGLYVDPGHHRQGVGARLIESAETLARGQGAAGLLVRAQAESQPFFAKSGYAKLPPGDDSRDYAHRYWKPI